MASNETKVIDYRFLILSTISQISSTACTSSKLDISLLSATFKPGKSRVFFISTIMEQHYTYVIYSPKHDKIYIGYSANPANRFIAHNHPKNKGSTKKFQPWVLIHLEKFDSKQEAMEKKYSSNPIKVEIS
jgi:putative endonuclease